LDETSFLAATAQHPTMLVTGIIDLDTGRLVDVLPARSAVAVTGWLAAKPAPWLAGIRHVVIDPYQPYATAAAKGLPAARVVVDHFHVIRLANAALDEVRRRTQNDALGHRGRKRDPSTGSVDGCSLATTASAPPGSPACSPGSMPAPRGEVGAAYLAKELLRDTYLAGDALEARRRIVTFYDHCTRSEVPELERLARTIARWETPILSWHRTRLTNAATEGTNLIIKEHQAARLRVPELRQLSTPAPPPLRHPMATSTGRINTTPPTTHQRVEIP
jgi:transposase